MEYPNFVYSDNQPVVMNAILPDSTINNKINSVVYHFVQEGSAKYEWRCGRVGTDDNPSDLINNLSIYGDNCTRKVNMSMYDI